MTQKRRSQILNQFKHGRLDILVATDVAARGIDVEEVSHVYNYDIPQDPDSYVHRVGRTGRAGHHGVSLTFVTPNEMDYLREIEKLTKVRMLPLKPPSAEEAFVGQLSNAEETVQNLVKKTDTSKYEDMANSLLENYEAVDLVAALLNDVTKDDSSQVPVKITPERPLPRRGGRHGGNNNHRGNNHGGNRRYNSKNGSRDRRSGGNHRSDRHSDHRSSDHKSGSNKRQFTIRSKG